jgi:hypothetical protein
MTVGLNRITSFPPVEYGVQVKTNRSDLPEANLIEKDSPAMALILLTVIFSIILAGLAGLAYLGGVFTGRDAVLANDKRITEEAHQDSSSPQPQNHAQP